MSCIKMNKLSDRSGEQISESIKKGKKITPFVRSHDPANCTPKRLPELDNLNLSLALLLRFLFFPFPIFSFLSAKFNIPDCAMRMVRRDRRVSWKNRYKRMTVSQRRGYISQVNVPDTWTSPPFASFNLIRPSFAHAFKNVLTFL